jgi:hypothetical protein
MGLARSCGLGFIVKPKTKAHQVYKHNIQPKKKKHGIHIVIVAQLVVKIIDPIKTKLSSHAYKH